MLLLIFNRKVIKQLDKGIEDIRLRLSWCREIVALLNVHGVSTGANYDDFDQYVETQLRDAEKYLP